MARGYGLFAANPLGSQVYSEGKEELNLTLAPGASTTLTYRILLQSGEVLSRDSIDALYRDFAQSY